MISAGCRSSQLVTMTRPAPTTAATRSPGFFPGFFGVSTVSAFFTLDRSRACAKLCTEVPVVLDASSIWCHTGAASARQRQADRSGSNAAIPQKVRRYLVYRTVFVGLLVVSEGRRLPAWHPEWGHTPADERHRRGQESGWLGIPGPKSSLATGAERFGYWRSQCSILALSRGPHRYSHEVRETRWDENTPYRKSTR